MSFAAAAPVAVFARMRYGSKLARLLEDDTPTCAIVRRCDGMERNVKLISRDGVVSAPSSPDQPRATHRSGSNASQTSHAKWRRGDGGWLIPESYDRPDRFYIATIVAIPLSSLSFTRLLQLSPTHMADEAQRAAPSLHYCHECGSEIRPLLQPGPVCPRCGGDFLEEVSLDKQRAPDRVSTDLTVGLSLRFSRRSQSKGVIRRRFMRKEMTNQRMRQTCCHGRHSRALGSDSSL